MTAVTEDAAADLRRKVAELEERLTAALTERDAAIERQTANALVNFRLQSELRAAVERQHASAEILRAISEGSGDAEQSLTQIAETTARLFGAPSVTIRIAEGDEWIKTIRVGASSQASGAQPGSQSAARGANLPATVYQENRQIHIPDLDHLDPSMADWPLAATRAAGARTVSGTPLRRKDKAIGALIVYRDRLAPFTTEELALQQSFADQAVIAIENARLFNETKEALERQTATADILKVIASSPSDVQPVFEAVVRTAQRLLRRELAFILRCDATKFWAVANAGLEGPVPVRNPAPVAIDPATNFPSRAIVSKENLVVPDWSSTDLPEQERHIREIYGLNSALYLPLLRGGECIGVLGVGDLKPGSFSEAEIALAESFRDQAVIAIENTRLFNETKEALERQTATADILKVIASSPSDVQPVFEAIAERARSLLGGFSSTVYRFIEGQVHLEAFTPTTPEADEILTSTFPLPIARFAPFEIVEAGEVAQIPDTESLTGEILDIARARGFRSLLFAPLMNKGTAIGLIAVTRVSAGAFAGHHVQLLKTFADQAVIAIENTRLFNEVQARTRDLEESLQQQTATADVLKVISRSAFDLEAVMNTLARSASELCAADYSALFLRDGDTLVMKGRSEIADELVDFMRNTRVPVDETSHMGRAVLHGDIANIPDIERDTRTELRTFQNTLGFKSILVIPLMREGRGIGAFALARNRVEEYSQRQVELVQTFADQAVIAIENARLFDEVQARTRDLSESLQQQTATADVLKVISRSTFDLQTVLETLIESAVELSGGNRGSIFLREGDVFPLKAASRATPEFLQYWAANPARAGRGSATSRVIQSGKVEVIPDVLEDPEMQMSAGSLVRIRGTLGVPMLRDNKVEGVLVLTRPEPGPFTKSQIDLVQTFADQAVIAVENVRLFDEAQARTRELAKSLDELRTAQDRLIQTEKLASLGQLTAGIAHEIKNPLNFVNNFAALSAELTDELKDVLKPAVLDETIRAEVDELTGLMKDNLSKVVQHGKRADSIVKNMLLHSREGSGDHRPADVNALVEESLNLAYHGARAEKPQFNVTLERDFDPEAGMIEAFPQEITRVLLNLISNGFYAVSKRKAEDGDAGYEPVVIATTKGNPDHVEIRIRDNGTGIPPDVKEKMFNPFFTTKPAGEGTGLGLSMSHDIIVKQHGGTIDVDTLPGAFTEFTIVLPRTSQFSDKTRGQM
jgi:two-component system, NtrC family, sensor kinase